jgi:hypothetical protein
MATTAIAIVIRIPRQQSNPTARAVEAIDMPVQV